jgi:hypothetical protein
LIYISVLRLFYHFKMIVSNNRRGEKTSLEARLDRYLQEHKGERVHIKQLTKRFKSLPNAIIHKLELFHWRPCGGGYFINDSTKTSE